MKTKNKKNCYCTPRPPHFGTGISTVKMAAKFEIISLYRVLKHLMLHLQRVSERCAETGMSSKNLAICWAPNLLRISKFNGQCYIRSYSDLRLERRKPSDQVSTKMAELTKHFLGCKMSIGISHTGIG